MIIDELFPGDLVIPSKRFLEGRLSRWKRSNILIVIRRFDNNKYIVCRFDGSDQIKWARENLEKVG